MATESDRYVTYTNIDCEGNAKKLLLLLRKHIDNQNKSNLFWEKFKEKLAKIDAPDESTDSRLDEIFLIHNRYEIFEEYDDEEALQLLDKIERECC